MFEPARRWRLLAAVGLVLALAQARAWGQETLWMKAANLTCRIGNLPRAVIRKPRPAAQPPAPIFAWEKKDAAEWDFAVGTCLEIIRDYQWAYFHSRASSRRCPARPAFAAAARRAKLRWAEKAVDWDCCHVPAGYMYVGRRLVTDLDDVICWLIADEPEAPCAISSTSLACCDAEHSDGPISDDLNKEAKPDACAGYVPWGLSIPFDTGLFQSLVPKDRSFSMFPRPATPAAPAPVLPERKDMLPDSEHGRLLIDLGVIADPRDLLALPKPVAPIYFDGSRLPGRIMF